jgi:acetylornithine deacetylase
VDAKPHSAYPQIGASAIFRAARLIERIERIAEQLQSDQHKDFDPPYTTINVGIIKGGSAKNVVPGECRFTLEWRTIPGQESDFALNAVRKEVEHLRSADPDFECEIDAVRADDSFETAADSELVQFLQQAAEQSASTVAFGTEAPSMIALGAEAVVFGPGNIREAHRTVNLSRSRNSISAWKSSVGRSNVFACKRTKYPVSGNRPRNVILESNVIIVVITF